MPDKDGPGRSKDWMVWCRSREKDEEQRPFEVDGKEIFSKAKAKAGEKMDKKGDEGQSVRWKVWWRQSNIKCAVSEEFTSCWVHQNCHVADEEKAALKTAAGVSRGKDDCEKRLKGRERNYWMGTETGMLGGHSMWEKSFQSSRVLFSLLGNHRDEACTMTLVCISVLELKHPTARNGLSAMRHREQFDNFKIAHFLLLFYLLDHCLQPFGIIRRLVAHLLIARLGIFSDKRGATCIERR